MQFDFAQTSAKDRYKLLTGLVVPRPIALISTISPNGVVNVAPYSFFNVFSQDPALCIIGIERQANGNLKDSAANIEATAQFVVNLVNERIANAMNICAVDFPISMSELGPANLSAAQSLRVAPPRILQAPAALECQLQSAIMVGTNRRLVIGEIVAVHVDDEIIDAQRLHILMDAYQPIGRLSGNGYCRTRERFEMKRENFAEWQAG